MPMTLTIQALPSILADHHKWLRRDGGSRADLRDADLRDADLICADLRNADLRNANLRDANLSCADLSGANLRGANLRDADLRDADLRDADLICADLRNADLRNADLSGANLRGANLSRANLSRAKGLDPHRVQPLLMLLDQPGKIRTYKLVDKYGFSPMHTSGQIKYEIGKTVKLDYANTDVNDACAAGINVATLDWCLKEHQPSWRIFIVEFTAKDIACIPTASDGKFRLHRCKVVGEKSLEELGLVKSEEI